MEFLLHTKKGVTTFRVSNVAELCKQLLSVGVRGSAEIIFKGLVVGEFYPSNNKGYGQRIAAETFILVRNIENNSLFSNNDWDIFNDFFTKIAEICYIRDSGLLKVPYLEIKVI